MATKDEIIEALLKGAKKANGKYVSVSCEDLIVALAPEEPKPPKPKPNI